MIVSARTVMTPPEAKATGRPDQNCLEQVWEHTISQTPNLFGRLVFVASLRDPISKRYSHSSLESFAIPLDVDSHLRLAHQEVFQQWLRLTLGEQCGELGTYVNLNSLEDPAIVKAWGHAERLHTLCPAGITSTERSVFVSDLLLVVRSLTYDVEARH